MWSVLLFAALWVLMVAPGASADDPEKLIDGKVIEISFTDTLKSVKYMYQAVDPKATFSFTVFPTSEDDMDEEVVTSICGSADCKSLVFDSKDGYFVFEMPTVDAEEYNFNMVDRPIYIIMTGQPGVNVSVYAMSSILLKNERTVTINPKTDNDGYDYESNGYIRWFRVFACDRDDEPDTHGKITFAGGAPNFGLKAYVNFWNSADSIPGRPSSSDNCDATYKGASASITKSDKFVSPGWVFIGVDFTKVYEDGGDENENYELEITADLENPTNFITTSSEYETSLCFYEDCYEFSRFNPNDFLFKLNGEEEELDNLYFVAMIKDKYAHDHAGILTLEAMTSTFFEDTNHIHKVGEDGYMAFNSDEITTMRGSEVEDMYVAVSTTNMNKFLLPIDGISALNPNLTIVTTLIKNTEVIKMGRKTTTVTTNLINDWSDYSFDPVYGRRLILDTAGVNKPYYLIDTYGDGSKKPEILCNYYVDVKSHDGVTDVTDVNAGVYVGNGYANFPYYSTSSDGSPEGKDYAFPSKNFKANETEGIPMDTQVIRMETTHKEYYQDGTYILDVWDAPTNSSFDSDTGISLDVVAHPAWFITGNQEYGKTLNGESNYDYFIFKTTDISQGVDIYVELVDAIESDCSIGIYASFISLLPTSTSKFTKTGHYYASLVIPASAFDEYEDVAASGQYSIYIAINTTHKGEMKITVFEGMNQVVHIGDGESVELDLNVSSNNDDMRVVMFHSSETNNLSNLAIVVEGISEDWSDDVFINACVSDTLYQVFSLCRRLEGYMTSLSTSNKKGIILIPLSTEADLYPDYFIHLDATKNRNSTSTQSMITLTVFGEDYELLTADDNTTVTVDYKLEPLLLRFETKEGLDYILNLTVKETLAPNSIMNVKVCSTYPPESLHEPPDVSDGNVRNCVSDTLSYGGTLRIDLIGDTLINDNTVVNDLPFITSPVKYVALYPSKSSIGTKVEAELYEDVHVRANNDLTLLNGKYNQDSYFRLLILSRDSANSNDFLSFEFNGSYPVQYCVSTVPHMNIGNEKCIASLVNYTPGTQTTPIVGSIRLTDIDPYYNAKHDIDVYFTFFFPEGQEDDPATMKVKFSNTIVHYLPVIKSNADNMDDGTLFFEMTSGKRMSFYTMDFELKQNLRFFIIPDVSDANDDENNTSSYTTAKIAITHQTDYTKGFPKPGYSNADIMTAGIISYDINVSSCNGFNGKNYLAFIAEFLDPTISVPYGLYKAGFVARDNFGSAISQMTTMEVTTPYHFEYDPTNSAQPSDTPTGKTYYYPYITTNNVLIVTPCAGIPGVSTSFISPNPKGNDKYYSKSFPSLGHKIGTQYFAPFINYLNNGQDPYIIQPTGHIFNATFEYGLYVEDPDPRNNTRWSADMIIVRGDGKNSNGGPVITYSDVRVTSRRGAEVVVEFSEAISGYSVDPTITKTYIEYALFAMPAPKKGTENPNFDASPNTGCGMINYGFPLTVDSSNNVAWVRGTADTNADGTNNDNDTLSSIISLTSNVNPSDYKYPSNVRPNFDGTTNKDTSTFNINVVAREVIDDGSTGDNIRVVGYSAYSAIQVDISGSMPVTPGGLFSWEIAIIVIVVIIVVAAMVVVVMLCISKKRQSMGYGNIDGNGNGTNKHGLNVDLPDDDLSISASTSSTKTSDDRMRELSA